MTREDLAKVEKYLRTTFNLSTIGLRPRPRKTDSAEVYIGEEFIGTLSEDVEEGEKSYHFQMAILAEDLD